MKDKQQKDSKFRRGIFSHRKRSFNFEHKSFFFKIENDGCNVTIIEKAHNNSFSITTDFGGVGWLTAELDRARQRFADGRFFSKYQASYALFLLQRYNNKNGSFMSLSMLHVGVVKRVIVFPAGRKGEGWTGISNSFQQLIFSPGRGINAESSPKMMRPNLVKSIKEERISNVKDVVSNGGKQRKTGRSYAEVISSDKQSVSEMCMTEELNKSDNNWSKVVVCRRERLWDEWRDIQRSLNKLFKSNVVLHPFQPDKAVFRCKDVKEVERFGQKSFPFIMGPYTIQLQQWDEGDLSLNKKISCTGGWLEVIDLPLKWWNKEVFEEIGSKCGGLLRIDHRTDLMQHLFSARIKVKGRDIGFIPDEIDMSIGLEKFTIKLKAISKLDFSHRNRRRTPIAVEEFDRCVIDLEVEEDKPELEKENNERQNHLHGSQSLKEGNGEDDEEDGDKREARERDNANDLKLVPKQCEKNRPPNDVCSISIKQIFSTLNGGLDFSKDCTVQLKKNEFVYCNLGLSEEVRCKVGKFLIKGPNYFIKGEIRKELDQQRIEQSKLKAAYKSVLWYNEEDEVKESEDEDRQLEENNEEKNDRIREWEENFGQSPVGQDIIKSRCTDEDLIDSQHLQLLKGEDELEDDSEKNEYDSENGLYSYIDPMEGVKELLKETHEPPTLSKKQCSPEPSKQPNSPRTGSPVFSPNFTEASSSIPPPNLFHTNVDNPVNFSFQQSPKEAHLRIDIYDEFGIGGGASGVSGGLLHPYSPKVKPLWRAEECWKESLRLLSIAESAVGSRELTPGGRVLAQSSDGFIVRRRGILRPAVSLKNIDAMNDNAQNCLAGCRIESIDKDIAQKLVPNLCIPFNAAFYMPEAVNVHPQRYLEALYRACETLVENLSISGFEGKTIRMHKKSVNSLLELAGEYDAVIVCAGARASFLPELSGRLPLRMCRGVIAHLQLPDDDDNREEYPEHGPSILSDAWLAIHGSRELHMGSTWEWNSTNYSQNAPNEETSKAMKELVPKALAVYPGIKNWNLTRARAGLRAMPPLTSHGSLPLLGRVDDFVGGNECKEDGGCKFWLFTGLGSRGLLYHGWLGKVLAQAVLTCNEDLIPCELLEWRSSKIKK